MKEKLRFRQNEIRTKYLFHPALADSSMSKSDICTFMRAVGKQLFIYFK